MPNDEGNMMLDSPMEFRAAAAQSEECIAQSILPHEGTFVCHCNCGHWDVVTESIDEGLRLARQHTDQMQATAPRMRLLRN